MQTTYKLQIKPYDWFKKDYIDDENGEYYMSINAWGLDKDSQPYLIKFLNFRPSIIVQLPDYVNKRKFTWTKQQGIDIINYIQYCLKKDKNNINENHIVNYSIKYAPLMYGYTNIITEKNKPRIQIWFDTYEYLRKCITLLKNPIKLRNVGNVACTVWEGKIDPVLQFLTLARNKHCQWFEVDAKKTRIDDKISTLDREFYVDVSNMLAFPLNYVPGEPDNDIPMKVNELTGEKTQAFPIKPLSMIETKNWHVHPGTLCIDIETYSDNPKAMPIKTLKDHVVYMISCIYQRIGLKDTRKRYAIILGDCAELPKDINATIIKVSNEFDLCEALCDIIKEHDPEIISGYNILGYDYDYLNQRLENLAKEWNIKASRLIGVKPKIVNPPKWSSKAYGFNDNIFIDFPGRISIDMYLIIKRGYKLAKYDLDTVSKKFLKRGKHNVKAEEMFKIYEELKTQKQLFERCVRIWVTPENYTKAISILQTRDSNTNNLINIPNSPNDDEKLRPSSCEGLIPIYHNNIKKEVIQKIINDYEEAKAKMVKITLYCIEDSELVMDLIEKNHTWIGLNELCNIVTVSIVENFTRGQQIRVLSQIYYMIKPLGVIINSRPPSEKNYFGGYVGTPIPGLHDFVMVLDFASLYPSIIQAYNICLSTYIDEMDKSVPDSMCNIITCDRYNKDDNITERVVHKFVKPEYFKGYIPELVRRLVAERRLIRKEMDKLDEGSLEWITFNERQLSLKTAANSVYGVLGVHEGGILTLMQAAECVTSIGRTKIQFCNEYLIKTYNSTIIYNDTDSTMFTLPFVNNYEDAIIWMEKLAKELSDTMAKPMYLEAEKVGRMLAIKKKHYAFWYADQRKVLLDGSINPNYGKLKDYISDKNNILVRGIVLARRDNFEYLRTTYWNILISIMEKKPIRETLKILIDSCLELYHNKVHWSKLIIIRQLGAHYKSDNYFMKVFGEEIKALGRPANPGDRLEYLIVKSHNQNEKCLGYKLRLPETYFERLNNNLHEDIDTLYYLEKLLKKPIEKLWHVGYINEITLGENNKLDQDYISIFNILPSLCKKTGGSDLILSIYRHFNNDIPSLINYFTQTLKPIINTDSNAKYLYNKFKEAKKMYITGRNVINSSISKSPIKNLIKSIQLNKLDEFYSNLFSY